MIDCSECRKLIDSDLEEPLGPQDRASVANHLRECHACVTYRKERLQDSSILGRSVTQLTEQVEKREAAAPPPPPPRPSPWPWLVTVLILIGVGIGIVIYFQMPSPEDDGELAPYEPTGPGPTQTAGPETGPRRAPSRAGATNERREPTPPAREQRLVQGRVAAPDGRPASGARVILARSPDPGADCLITRAGEDGAFTFRVAGPLPVHLTAWTATALSDSTPVTSPALVQLALRPARRLEGRLAVEGDLDPATLRVAARWGRSGRSVSETAEDGTFTVTVPRNIPIELHPHGDELRTYTFRPDIPLTISPEYDGPIRLLAVPGRILEVTVLRDGRPFPAGTRPDLIAVLHPADESAHRLLAAAPDGPGSFRATVPPGVHQLVVRHRGYLESVQQVVVQEYAPIEVSLVESPAAISGRLRTLDRTTELPGSVTIRREPPLFPGEPGLAVSVGSDGRFRAAGIPWSRVTLQTDAKIPHRFGPFNAGTDADLPLLPGSRVEGVVRGPGGDALPGVLVTAETDRGKAHRQTDKAGRFSFTRLPAGTLYLYPQYELARIETMPALREQFRLDVPPNAALPKNLVLEQAAPSRVRVRDAEGQPVVGMVILKAPSGEPIQAAVCAPLDATRPAAGVGATLPPVRAGTYDVDVADGGVSFPIGRLPFPAKHDLVVHRARPHLRLSFTLSPAALRARTPLRLELRTIDGRSVSRFHLPAPQELEIGGLPAGAYRVVATRGLAQARGLLRIGAAGSPDVRLALTLR